MLRVNLLQSESLPSVRDGVPQVEFRELEVVRRMSRECGRGPVFIAVTGPAGAGKTTFLHQAEALLGAFGFETILTHAAAEHLACDPRQSLREWWQCAAHAVLPPHERHGQAPLAAVLPAEIETLPPQLRRECVAEFLWTGLRRTAERNPVALLIDDAPSLGETARRALERVMAAAAEARQPLLCIVVADAAWVQRRQHLESIAAHVVLRGLRGADLACDELVAHEGRAFAERLVERTGGLPQYLYNVLAAAREFGRRRPEEMLDLCAAAPADLVRERLARMPAERRETLGVFATCGRPAPAAFARRVLGRDALVFDAQLSALLRAGFVRRAGSGRVAVSDRLVCRSVCEVLPPERLARLHERIAAELEIEGGLAVEIFRHRELAGIDDREHARIAVRELRAMGQIEEAAALAGRDAGETDGGRALAVDLARDGMQRAADALRGNAAGGDAPVGEVEAALALAHAGKYEAAYQALCAAGPDESSYAGWLRTASAARIAVVLGRVDDAAALQNEAERRAQASGFAPLVARTCALDGERLLLIDDRVRAERALLQAYGALNGASPRLAAQAALGLAARAIAEGEFHQALVRMHRVALDLEQPVCEPWPVAAGQALHTPAANELADCRLLLDGGHTDAAERAFMTILCSPEPDRYVTGRKLLALADLVVAYGNDTVALACVTEALKRARGAAGVELVARANLVVAKVSVLVGNYARALASASGAFRGAALAYDREGLAEVCIVYARLLRVLGVLDLAARFCAMSRLLSAVGGVDRLGATIACEQAWIALAQDRRHEAVETASQAPAGDTRASLERTLIIAAAHGGDEGAARAQEVADAAKAAGIQDLIAEAALIVGRVRSHRGERSLLHAIELMQGVADLAQKRNRPELAVRAKIGLGELFVLRRRDRPAREFLRDAGADLVRLRERVPRVFRAHFLAKPEYRRAVEAMGGAEVMAEERDLAVENLLKTSENIA
jgi:type II secretory pathway predicted ATPase ExeA